MISREGTFLHLKELQSYAEGIGVLLINGPRWAGDRKDLGMVGLPLLNGYDRCSDHKRGDNKHYQPPATPLGVLRNSHSQIHELHPPHYQ